MGREANEHLARLDLKENLNTSSGSILPIPHLSQGFEYPVRQAQALCHVVMTLRPNHFQEKLLPRHVE
jgi:hypothetical protein